MGHFGVDIACHSDPFTGVTSCSQAMLRALLDANLMVRKAESAGQPQRAVGNILPLVLPSRKQHRCQRAVLRRVMLALLTVAALERWSLAGSMPILPTEKYHR